jgi:hypothetical protein
VCEVMSAGASRGEEAQLHPPLVKRNVLNVAFILGV